MSDIAKKFIGYKAVVCGDTVEFYHYDYPFYADFQRDYDIEKGDPEGELEKRMDSLTRARKNIRQIVLANLTPHTKLLTLTYAETQLDKEVFAKDFQAFCQKMKRNGFKLRYLQILERQLERGKKEGNAGSIHPHLVIFNDKVIPMNLLKAAWPHGRLEIHMLHGLRYDGREVEKTNGEKIRNAGAYICKYINKEAQLEWGSRTYRCSIGLNRPVEHNFYSYKTENANGSIDYTTDDYDGYMQLREYCNNYEYSYHQKIRYVTGDGRVMENVIHCTQVQVNPECKKQVADFVKRFDFVPDEDDIAI